LESAKLPPGKATASAAEDGLPLPFVDGLLEKGSRERIVVLPESYSAAQRARWQRTDDDDRLDPHLLKRNKSCGRARFRPVFSNKPLALNQSMHKEPNSEKPSIC
jgi:hypothetical protein